MPVTVIGADGEPVELAPGRGDLRYSSVPLDPAAPALQQLERPAPGLKQVSYATIVATQPWVAAAIMRFLTWAVRVPLKTYRREPGSDSRTRLRPGDHPVADAIARPWDGASSSSLVLWLLEQLLTHGNALAEVEVVSSATDAMRFAPADWRFAEPVKVWRGEIGGWDLDQDDAAHARTRGAKDVIHVAWPSPLGPVGISPLQQLGITVQIEAAAQTYQRALFQNGARPPSAFTLSEKLLGLDPEKQKQVLANLREDVTNLHAGTLNAGRPPLLPPGMGLESLDHQTAVEAALIEQRKVARNEVAAVYQIPPPMIGDYDKGTYSNVDTARDMSYTDALAPYLTLIEQALNGPVIQQLLGLDDVYVEFDYGAVLRGDRLKEIAALGEAVNAGLMTRNEARGVLNQAASRQHGMDVFYYPANNSAPVGTVPGSGDPSTDGGDSPAPATDPAAEPSAT